MNDLQLFKFENKDVRTLQIDGEPWFVGKDIAQILDYTNPSKAIRDHIADEDKLMGVQNVTPYIVDRQGRSNIFPS